LFPANLPYSIPFGLIFSNQRMEQENNALPHGISWKSSLQLKG